MEIVNTEDMRKMDAEAIHEYGIPGIILMEHAAMAVMDYIREHVAKDSRIMILCGPGNNGGMALPLHVSWWRRAIHMSVSTAVFLMTV